MTEYKIKGVYLFKSEALDVEETVTFEGQHTFKCIYDRFNAWLREKAGGSVEEISYTETSGMEASKGGKDGRPMTINKNDAEKKILLEIVKISEDILYCLEFGLSAQPNSALHRVLKDKIDKHKSLKG